ncbi:MAG: DUF1772 domain-containing protein [Alphaproteobacteria bacterium]
MTQDWTLYLCLFLALWSAIVGGVFSAFSEFIMAALRRSSPAVGIEAMQQINRTVLRTQFVAGIIVIAPASVLLAIYAVIALEGSAIMALMLAPAVYLPTVFLMTIFGNVPMNNKLDRLDAHTEEAATYWSEYNYRWTRLNHLRSIGSIVTAVIYLAASMLLIQGHA